MKPGAGDTPAHAGEDGPSPGVQGKQGATGIGKGPAPRADVLVTVPVFSLLGATDEPAVLDGFGPIPASMARKLVADGANSFYRVLVDPRDGAPLEIGRKNYRLTGAIKHWIRLRDTKCTFPGCTNKTPDNETDHLTAWQHGGTTKVSNLAQLCPKHHRLKHHSQWTPDPATRNQPPGWTSPTGRHYNAERSDPEPTHWPQWLPALFSGAPEQETSIGATEQTAVSTESQFQFQCQCLDTSLGCPPPWEPEDLRYVDLYDLPADDPLWAEFLATLSPFPGCHRRPGRRCPSIGSRTQS